MISSYPGDSIHELFFNAWSLEVTELQPLKGSRFTINKGGHKELPGRYLYSLFLYFLFFFFRSCCFLFSKLCFFQQKHIPDPTSWKKTKSHEVEPQWSVDVTWWSFIENVTWLLSCSNGFLHWTTQLIHPLAVGRCSTTQSTPIFFQYHQLQVAKICPSTVSLYREDRFVSHVSQVFSSSFIPH